MGELIAWDVVTLDGFFEGPEPWDLSFHEIVWGPELVDRGRGFSGTTELLVFGRRTYEGMASYWTTVQDDDPVVTAFMNAVPKLVASHTLTEATWENTEVTSDIIGEVTRRKAAATLPLRIFGSADLLADLLEAGLVDEIDLCVAPVLLGAGRRLFESSPHPRRLDLVEAAPLSTGGALLRYTVPTRADAAARAETGARADAAS